MRDLRSEGGEPQMWRWAQMRDFGVGWVWVKWGWRGWVEMRDLGVWGDSVCGLVGGTGGSEWVSRCLEKGGIRGFLNRR
jgi:hypothetical protein